jgi:DNA-binding transcriptional LysR family regulator
MSTRYNLNRLAYFVATIDEGTITAAAERLGVSKAVVSKQLQLLEADVGVGLLLRNTRNLQPTEAGRALYAKGKAAVLQASDAFESVMERDSTPRGRLRVTAPVDYGIIHVAPLVARFCEIYPDVEIDLVLADERVDLIESRFDLSFRLGWLEDSGNVARKLRDFEEIAVATPATLHRFPVRQPEDLCAMPFIANSALAGLSNWDFTRGAETRTVALRIGTSMNVTFAIRMAITSGAAFTILPDFLAEADLASGKLQRLLPDWSLRRGGVYTVTASGRVRGNALRAFLAMAYGDKR